MPEQCPLSFKQIDGNIARIGAFFVLVLITSYLLTSEIVILYILAIDFYIRIYVQKRLSPIYQLSKISKKILKIETKFTDSGAKRLAAQFGLLFSILLIIQAHFNLNLALIITASALLVCASLEVVFNYCIGCKIYYIIKKIYPDFST